MLELTLQAQRHVNRARPVRREPEEKRAPRMRHKRFAQEGNAANAVFRAMHGRFKVQPAERIRFLRAGLIEQQIADGEIVFGVAALRLGFEKRLRFVQTAGERKRARFAPCSGCAGTVRIVGMTGPEGVFVEGDALVRRAAEEHRAERTVADRERFRPGGGRLGIPELLHEEGLLANLLEEKFGKDERGSCRKCRMVLS